jgi:hypothetical protein
MPVRLVPPIAPPPAGSLCRRQRPECQALLPAFHCRTCRPCWRADRTDRRPGDDHSLSPPHERALARALGLPAADGRIPWAAAQSDTPTAPQAWFSLCHFQVGMDQVTLLPGAQLGLDDADSRALFEAFAPLCAEDGLTCAGTAPPNGT